uniref:Uncharacterized protein n=1 Tax=Knipowitschia caucasica TaxID=637954 RepID=A0AAV2K9F4_KNICA
MRPPNTSLFVRNIADESRNCKNVQLWSGHKELQRPISCISRKDKGQRNKREGDVRDAEDALHSLDRKWVCGRQIEIQFAQGDRKTPNQMKTKEQHSPDGRSSRYDDYDRDGRRRRSRSRSYERYRSRSPSYDRRRRRSGSPRESHRRRRSRSPEEGGYKPRPRRESRARSRSRSPTPREDAPAAAHFEEQPRRKYSRSRSASRSRSRSRSWAGRKSGGR